MAERWSERRDFVRAGNVFVMIAVCFGRKLAHLNRPSVAQVVRDVLLKQPATCSFPFLVRIGQGREARFVKVGFSGMIEIDPESQELSDSNLPLCVPGEEKSVTVMG